MIQIPCMCTVQCFGDTPQNIQDRRRFHRRIGFGACDEHFLQSHSFQPLQNQEMAEHFISFQCVDRADERMVQSLDLSDLPAHCVEGIGREHSDLIRKEKQCAPGICFKIHRLPDESHLAAPDGFFQSKFFA